MVGSSAGRRHGTSEHVLANTETIEARQVRRRRFAAVSDGQWKMTGSGIAGIRLTADHTCILE